MRLIPIAVLLLLAALSPVSALERLGTPIIGIEQSGSCRALTLRDQSNTTDVPIGCIDTSTHSFDLLPGSVRLTPGAAAPVDLITPSQAVGLQSPANGQYLSGGVAKFLFNPAGGPFLAPGLTGAQNVGFMTTTGGNLLSEFMFSDNMISNTGYPAPWSASRAYAAYDSVARGGYIYNNITGGGSKIGCTSGSTGPSGTGPSIRDGTCLWAWAPTGTPQNGGKALRYQSHYVDNGANQAWTAVDNLILGASGRQINAFTREIDITNNRLDYGAGGYGGSAVALQLFAGGARRSSAALAIGQSSAPTDAASFVNAVALCCGTLASNATVLDLTGSANGYMSQGSHMSSFTDASTALYAFNAYGTYSGAAYRVGGTAATGMYFDGNFSAYQVLGNGWNVNPSGAVTTTGVIVTAGELKPAAYTVAGAYVCSGATKGSLITFTDLSAAPTYRQTGFTGGGSIAAPGFCNGTSWEIH